MITIFTLNGVEFDRWSNLPAYLPIGATIPSRFKPTDPADKRGKLRVASAPFVDYRRGTITYAVEPV